MDTEPEPRPSSPQSDGELPEKYIRTFEGDMSTFQKGITPNLAPMGSPRSTPSERLIAASPAIGSPVTVAPEASEPPSLAAVTPVEVQATPLKTYSNDFRERMEESNASTATVLAAEQDAPIRFFQATSAAQNGNRWPVVAGVILLVIGGIGVYFAYVRYLSALTPVVATPPISAPIFVDSREQISGTGTALAQAIRRSADEPLTLNTVRLLSLGDTAGSGGNVFTALDMRVPGAILRNMNATGNAAGVVKTGAGQGPFFILSVGSYGITFSNMLAWEPVMLDDFGILYPLSSGAAMSGATTTPVQKGGFRDEVASNHDVRVYRDSAGRSVMLYGYWNPTTLVIARDPSAFAEILGRLATSNTR